MKQETKIQFERRLASLRKKQDLTQEELSAILGITRAAVSHYETKQREPDLETLVAIADHFKVTTDYLIGRS